MLKIDKGVPAPKRAQKLNADEKSRRLMEMKEMLTFLEVGDSTVFTTENISAWRVAFCNLAKTPEQKLMEFRTAAAEKENEYRIWRTK